MNGDIFELLQEEVNMYKRAWANAERDYLEAQSIVQEKLGTMTTCKER